MAAERIFIWAQCHAESLDYFLPDLRQYVDRLILQEPQLLFKIFFFFTQYIIFPSEIVSV